MSELSVSSTEVSDRLLAWYSAAGRELPWRTTRDPYRIWLSEVMLQQTTVEAVIPYYQRFLESFATVEQLASAPLDSVLDLWAGLGYYSRARNLHKAAQMVVEDYAGEFPDDLTELQKLPGIGRSTAGAIRSIAFDLPGPILDGNVRRVLCRLNGVTDDPRAGATEKRLWQWAEELTPDDRPHDYAQAIMDLGATVCTPRNPECENCPFAPFCVANLQGLQAEIPAKRKKKPVPKRTEVTLLVDDGNGSLLVRKRPYDGMLGGLWEFPCVSVEEGMSVDAAVRGLTEEIAATDLGSLGEIKHVYSHFELTCKAYHCRSGKAVHVAEELESRCLSLTELQSLSLHGAHKKVLALFEKNK